MCHPLRNALLVSGVLISALPQAGLVAEEPAAPQATPALEVAGLDLEDQLEPLAPKVARSEADEDELEALALFATGRMLEQKQDLPAALRCYQRALRYGGDSVAVLKEIVPLAFGLGRSTEGLQYAVKLSGLDTTESEMLRRLAVVLTEQGQHEQALALYEKAWAREKNQPLSAAQVMLQMEMGRLYFISKRYPAAAQSFSPVLAALTKPDSVKLSTAQKAALTRGDGVALELMAEAFLETNRTAEALAAYAKLNEIAPKPAVHAYHLARVKLADNKPAEALDELKKYFAAQEKSREVDPYLFLEKVLVALGRGAEFLPKLEALHESDPENASLAYVLAARCLKEKKYHQARPLYEAALKTKPTAEGYAALAEIYRELKDDQRLLELLAEVVGKSGSLEPLGDQAQQITSDEGLLERLLLLANKPAEGAQAGTSGAARAAAELALDTKQHARAADFYERALAEQPKEAAAMLLSWGMELLRQERYEDAGRVFERGEQEGGRPDDDAVFPFYRSGALALAGKPDEALSVANEASQRQPKVPRLRTRPAWILYHAKRYEEAKAAYTKFVNDFDDDYATSGVRESLREARLVLSNIAVLQERPAEAVEWLQQVLDEFPGDVSASNDLGYLWCDQGLHLERSLRMTQHAVAAEPDNLAYRDSLGWALYKLGRYSEAVVELERAAADKNADGVILEHLGEVYARLGQSAKAVETWKRAAKAYDGEDEKKKLASLNEKISLLEQGLAR